MPPTFTGKTVVITGSRGAVGRALVDAFAAAGATVAGIDRTPPSPSPGLAITADLAEPDAIARAFDEIEDALGPADVLVQSAAVLLPRRFLELTAQEIDATLAVNVRALLLCAQRAARGMLDRDRPGVIVNLGSIAARASDAASVAYDASKGAVAAATRGMAVALGPHGVRVVEVAPGAMTRPQAGEERDPHDLDDYARVRVPLARWATPADVTAAVLFVASDGASYLTGTTLAVDGGTLARW